MDTTDLLTVTVSHPLHHWHMWKRMPLLFIAHGDQDTIVIVKDTRNFASKLPELNLRYLAEIP